MNNYTEYITLSKNNRGCWDLDPFKGCTLGKSNGSKGCYGVCYAAKIAKFRGYDFNKVITRNFKDEAHLKSIGNKISKLEFLRMGVSCDPSYDWDHTISIIEKIKPFIEAKRIVIVTKHINKLTDKQILKLKGLTINTSISALDGINNMDLINYRLKQYSRLKKYTNSILRVNTAKFINMYLEDLQLTLLDNDNVINTILRIPKSNIMVKNGTLEVAKVDFLGSETYASIFDTNTYFGNCDKCIEKCGLAFF